MTTWSIPEFLSQRRGYSPELACNLVQMFEADNTIPFIARYRKEKAQFMAPDQLRLAFQTYSEAKSLQAKVERAVTKLAAAGQMSDDLKVALLDARSIEQLDALTVPYKTGSKGTLAERARQQGLDEPATRIVNGATLFSLSAFVQANGLQSEEEVRTGIQHILADRIYRRPEMQQFLQQSLENLANFLLTSKLKSGTNADVASKFHDYTNFTKSAAHLKFYQTLAINRGEALKALSVKIVVDKRVNVAFKRACRRTFPKCHDAWLFLLTAAQDDCYGRLVEPFLRRRVRSNLTELAQEASVETFARNLRQLLMVPPCKGCIILGVDPGFKHGCKYAFINTNGNVLDTGIFYLNDHLHNSCNISRLVELMRKHRCKKVAIGNGTACRETEQKLSEMIQQNVFHPLSVQYCIVAECGASVYSASDCAQEELPDLDVSLRGAVSLARRLQDPLAEYVKVEPKHLGVGMYQHDCNEKLLQTTLDLIVQECVSFVGVDVNTCSVHLLRKVAGLNAKRAASIVAYREANGGIRNRQELRSVAGIGEKSFEQCAGFVRVFPHASLDEPCSSLAASNTSASAQQTRKRRLKISDDSTVCKKKRKTDSAQDRGPCLLDATSVHPESYHIANKLLTALGLTQNQIGQVDLLTQQLKTVPKEFLLQQCGTCEAVVDSLLESLRQPLSFDCREQFDKPLFRSSVRKLEDVAVHHVLTGCVRNVTDFGAFVDIGVGQDGLLHRSKMLGHDLQVGRQVQVRVVNVDLRRRRIGLEIV